MIPMAFNLPNATFLGIDQSERQIAEGARRVEELGIENIELRHGSVEAFDRSEGTFDYVICHGIYSWVDDAARRRILATCGSKRR